jgi:hypothetical protein
VIRTRRSITAAVGFSRVGVEELDLLLANRGVDDGLCGFSYDVPVECKTPEHPVDSQAVQRLAGLLRRCHAGWGILVSLSGITGDRSTLTSGHREVVRAAHEGQHSLVLAGSEMRGLRSAAHLVALLQRKRDVESVLARCLCAAGSSTRTWTHGWPR